ncbi:class II aldolase/adducin family protein [Micromonospora sediminicola]|uniref:class II aldolase/adducin family protein n=1 Tax=Micromonospora sediminicola TaxID=946078 RepID=UPI0033D95F45
MSTATASRRHEQERTRRRHRLAAALRLFARFGFDEGAGGHITARDPEHLDTFWINPFGVNFAHVRASDLLLVNGSGDVIAGEGRINPAGFIIHSSIHHARADVVAVAHSHSVHGRAWATLGRRLAPLTQDACAFYRHHEVFDEFDGVVLDLDEGKRIAARLAGNKAIILRNHGLLTVGGTVDEAAWWFIAMDRACQVQLLAEAAGKPVMISPEAAESTAAVMGTPAMGRLNFRPLYYDIIRSEPDLLE